MKREITEEFLREEYVVKKKRKYQIAKEVGVCQQTLDKYFKKFNIKTNPAYTYRSKDLSGMRFGKLVVKRRSGTDNHKKSRWYCECDCGGYAVVNASSLLRNLTRSCKCELLKEARRGGYKQISKSFWRRAVESSNARGVPFEITMEYVWEIYENQGGKCVYTGIPVSFCCNSNTPSSQTASIDRIDSAKGYVPGNIQIVHKMVNFMKRNFTHEEFLAACNLIAENHRRDHEDSEKRISAMALCKIRSSDQG